MNGSQIHHAIGELSEEIIAPVAKLRQKKRYPIVKWAAVAACLCLLLSLPLGRNDLFVARSESVNDGVIQEAPQENKLTDSCGSAHASVFRASVLQVYEGSGILVEPLEGEAECGSSDRFEVSFEALEQIPQIEVGDVVEITYDGMIQELYPCRIPGIIAIKVIE